MNKSAATISPQNGSGELDERRLERLRTRYRNPSRAVVYHANRYGDIEGRINLYAMQRGILRALEAIPRGGRVLDIPCGTAQYTWFLASRGYRVRGTDVSPQMLEVASKPRLVLSGPEPEFSVADIFNLHFAPGSFDAAVSIRFFHLLTRAERMAAVKQMAKVAGVVIADYGHKYTLKHFSRVLRYQLGLRCEPRMRFCRAELIREISEAGMELRNLIWIAPGLSEIWLAVMTPRVVK